MYTRAGHSCRMKQIVRSLSCLLLTPTLIPTGSGVAGLAWGEVAGLHCADSILTRKMSDVHGGAVACQDSFRKILKKNVIRDSSASAPVRAPFRTVSGILTPSAMPVPRRNAPILGHNCDPASATPVSAARPPVGSAKNKDCAPVRRLFLRIDLCQAWCGRGEQPPCAHSEGA